MFWASSHLPQRDRETCGNQEDRKHLKKVGERCGIFKRMRTVRIGKTTSVCSQHLDCLLRGYWTLSNRLSCYRGWFTIRPDYLLRFDELCLVIWPEVLDNAL